MTSTLKQRDSQGKPLIAVVSPFLDKQHGTERCVVEQIERLAAHYEVHLYSNRVEDVDLSRIVWHRVPALPGPHLFSYCWWFLANNLWRWWDREFSGVRPVLVYTPGINCFNADVISVHIVFAEFYRRVRQSLSLHSNPISSWPRLLHRRIYYRLIICLEELIYRRKACLLTAVSGKVAQDLQRYGRAESELPIIIHGIDVQKFSPEARSTLRAQARQSLPLDENDFCLLLVGNDWKKKGLDCALEALDRLHSRIRLLVVGHDSAAPFLSKLAQLAVEGRMSFLPPLRDVEFYYAAADLYVGPSLEDAFAMPPMEAMACGVPAIVSSRAGVSEIICDGEDGFVLADPEDSVNLARLIEMLYRDEVLRLRVSAAAAKTARQYTWDRNAAQLDELFQEVLQRKSLDCAHVPAERAVR